MKSLAEFSTLEKPIKFQAKRLKEMNIEGIFTAANVKQVKVNPNRVTYNY